MKKQLTTIFALCTLLSLSGCATYHLSTQSLLEQFAGSQKEKKIMIFLLPPFVFFPGVVNGNDLREITVLDKKEQHHTLSITHHTAVRITKKNKKKVTFYFNTLLLKDSTITGSKTHFFNAPIRPVLFADIYKIELSK